MADERLDYTQRDESTAISRIQRLVRSIYPNWDFTKKDIGNAILKAMAWLISVLSWLTDFWAREALPTKATLRRSVKAHTRWVGYAIKGRTAATVPITLSLSAPHAEDIIIPAGTQFSVPTTGAPLLFQLQSGVSLLSPAVSVSGVLEHAELVQESEVSSGRPWQQFRLAQSPFLDGSLTVSAANGSYTIVENLLQSGISDRHCYIEIDDDERAIVLFGDGVTGEIPSGSVNFSYKVGGGLEGNVEPTDWDAVNPVLDVAGSPVNLSAASSVAATGGDDGESLAKAKSNAIANLVTRNRTVTREDYETQALTVSGVSRALCLTAAELGMIREGEAVVWVVARGSQLPSGRYKGAVPTAPLLAQVEATWSASGKPDMMHIEARAVGEAGMQFKSVNVVATVFPASDAPADLGQKLYDALADFFAVELADGSPNPAIQFGYYANAELPWSDVFNVIRDVQGVRKVEYNGLTLNGSVADVSVKVWELPKLGTVSLHDDRGNPLTYSVS